MALAFQFHNARILINRPCLCRLGYQIPNESNRSRGFDRSAAATCVSGARETVALLPDEPNPRGLIATSPWWCLLHYLVSAGAILMMEIAMRAEHNPQQAEALLNDAKKIVRWLRAMSKDNIAAERSWAVLSKLLLVSAPRIGGDTTDVERDLDGFNAAKQRSEKLPQRIGIADHQSHSYHYRDKGGVTVGGGAVTIDLDGDHGRGADYDQQGDYDRGGGGGGGVSGGGGGVDARMPSFGGGAGIESGDGGDIQMHSMDGAGGAINGVRSRGPTVFSPVENVADVQEIFRGLIADPFPFGNIPIHSPFDNLTDKSSVDSNPNSVAPDQSRFAAVYHNDHPMGYSHAPSPLHLHSPPLPTPAIKIGEISLDRVGERLQKRLSRGVSNICMPPPPKFPQWSTVDRFGMIHVAQPYEDCIEFGRVDLHRTTAFAHSAAAAENRMPAHYDCHHEHHHHHPQSPRSVAAGINRAAATTAPCQTASPNKLRKRATDDDSGGHCVHGGQGDNHGNTNSTHHHNLYMR